MRVMLGRVRRFIGMCRSHHPVSFGDMTGLSVVDEVGLARALKVEERDIKRAIKNEQLKLGRHYFLVNDKRRFRLSNDLIDRLMEDAVFLAMKIDSTSKNDDCSGTAASQPVKARNRRGRNRAAA